MVGKTYDKEVFTPYFRLATEKTKSRNELKSEEGSSRRRYFPTETSPVSGEYLGTKTDRGLLLNVHKHPFIFHHFPERLRLPHQQWLPSC